MKFPQVSLHVTLISKSAAAVLNKTVKKLSLVLKKVTSQVVLSSIAGVAYIFRALKWPLQKNKLCYTQ